MTMKEAMRQSTREMLVQLAFMPLAVVAILALDGKARIFALAVVAIGAYMAVDGVRGKFNRPLKPSAVTRSLVSNTLFVAFMATAILIGIAVTGQ